MDQSAGLVEPALEFVQVDQGLAASIAWLPLPFKAVKRNPSASAKRSCSRTSRARYMAAWGANGESAGTRDQAASAASR